MNKNCFLRFPILLLFVCTVCAATQAQGDTNDYIGSRWDLVDSAKVISAAAAITTQAYPDCDTAIVEQRSVRSYRADGSGEAQDETFEKVLTEKGRRQSRTLGMGFMLPYNTVSVVKLEVIKPDGSVTPVDIAANSKESIDESQMSMNIYDPNVRVLQVNIPKLDIGDVVHSVTRTTTQRAIIPGEYAEETLFEGDSFIRHETYEVFSPKERPLVRTALRDEIPGTVSNSVQTNADGSMTYLWEATNVPRMFDEPGMPPYEMVLQRLYVSTLPDWQAVSKWYWKLSLPHLEATTPEMLKTNEVLTAGMTNEMEKIKAIFYYVSKNVRYMGLTPEKDRPGFEPHDVKLTFDKNYGVCRDKAGLLVEMLRLAGLKAYPVLISVGCKRDPEVPDPGFNHAIVAVKLQDGSYQLMDPTDENTRELLPYYDRDQSYLVCCPEGETLLTSPVESPDKNLMHVATTGTLSAAGELAAHSELVFEGVNDDAYRNAFVKMKPDDLRRFFERDLKNVLPGASLQSIKVTPENMLDMTHNIHVQLEYTATGLTADGRGKAVMTMPWIGKGVGILNFILRDTGLEKRKYPLETGATCGLVEKVALKLGDGFENVISLPECAPVDDPCLSCHQDFTWTNHTINATRELKLNVVEFSPAQYLTLKKTLKDLEYDARKMPVLALAENARTQAAPETSAAEAMPVQSDAVILDSDKRLDITGENSGTLRVTYSKRILSYNGKKREAELKIPFNPSCQSARIVHAATISRDGKRSDISPDEINVMDASWNASAKRYPGGKILVANLPDVDIGSTIEVEFEIAETNRPFLAGYESFQFPDELQAKSVELTAPAKLKIHKFTSGEKGEITEAAKTVSGRQAFSWMAKDVKPLPAESQLPPLWLYNSGVSYFVGDVKDYYHKLEQVMLDRAAKNTQAAALARQLAASATNRMESLRIIRDYIVQNVRVAGPAFTELPLENLSDADVTLADGYGHLADRAILFDAMLSAAGFKPEFVLASELPPISSISKVLDSVPMPQQFQYPLVRVKVDGQVYYLNDTDQYARLGTTAHANQLGVSLANAHLMEIKPAKNCGQESETHYEVSLNDNGQAQITVTHRYFGTTYNARKRYFAELPPEERRRYFQEIVSDVAQSARPIGDLVTKFNEYPGIEKFTVSVDHFAVVDGKYYYFDLPYAPMLFPPGADTRVLPLFVSDESKRHISAEIALPKDFSRVVIAPSDKKLKAADAGSARVTTSREDGKFEIAQDLEITPAIVSPKDYQSLQRTEAELREKSGRVFLLQHD